MKRILCTAMAAALLLAGCGTGAKGATAETAALAAATAAPQELKVYYTPFETQNDAARRVLEAYAAQTGVTVTTAESQDEAGLAVLSSSDGAAAGCRVLSGDSLLAAAGQRASLEDGFTAMPLGKTLYCYWGRSDMLAALLGAGYDPADLQSATWKEWSDFVDTTADWIAKPTADTVTLNGKEYTLPQEAAAPLDALTGVFALPDDAFAGTAYSAALVAAGEARNSDTLTGPITGLYNCFDLETEPGHLAGGLTRGESASLTQPVAETASLLGQGSALFARARMTDLSANLTEETTKNLVPVPQKCWFTEEDLSTTEYNVEGLTNYPVLTVAGWLGIPEAADDAAYAQGAGFLLWLYAGAAGEIALTEDAGIVTPWNTASEATDLGAEQVKQIAAGVIPEADSATALDTQQQAAQALAEKTTWGQTDRKTFVETVVEALSDK